MKSIVNQLNKVKISNKNDIEAESASQYILNILNHEKTFENKSVVILNSEAGILHVGINLLSPKTIIGIVKSSLDNVFRANISSFDVISDLVLSNTCPFRNDSFDFAVIGPILDKSKYTDVSHIEISIKIAKTVYFLFKDEHKQLIYDKYPNASTVDILKIKTPLSSKYHNQKSEYSDYTMFKITK